MKSIGLLREPSFETRISLLPMQVKKLYDRFGLKCFFEAGLGQHIGYVDKDYLEAGAKKASSEKILKECDIIISINPPENLDQASKGKTFIGIYNPLFFRKRIDPFLQQKATLYSLDLLPRTTIAQSMDVLSSMSSLSGYKAVVKAADFYQSGFPMLTTAAGTLKPVHVLVLGAGVAGLQAIATAKRLGAIITAFDVRSSAGEEVRSLGAEFLEVPGFQESNTAGGYAVSQSIEYLQKQKEKIIEVVKEASIVICTANIPGKKAPVLIDEQMVAVMKPGSIILDLASEQGGNCSLTKDNQKVMYNGIAIIGNANLSREIPQAASLLLSNNFFSFLNHIMDTRKDDPVFQCRVLENGVIVHPKFNHTLI